MTNLEQALKLIQGFKDLFGRTNRTARGLELSIKINPDSVYKVVYYIQNRELQSELYLSPEDLIVVRNWLNDLEPVK